jgi:hypothetical protein
MNMPVADDGTVHFTTTLFALIRESLGIKMGAGESENMGKCQTSCSLCSCVCFFPPSSPSSSCCVCLRPPRDRFLLLQWKITTERGRKIPGWKILAKGSGTFWGGSGKISGKGNGKSGEWGVELFGEGEMESFGAGYFMEGEMEHSDIQKNEMKDLGGGEVD